MKNNLMFNNMPGGERVQVPRIPSLLGCSQHRRATLLKLLKYANTQEAKSKTTRRQKSEDPTEDQV